MNNTDFSSLYPGGSGPVTFLPNIVFDLGLSAWAIALYMVLKGTAGEDGCCRKGTRDLASQAGMSAGKLRKATAELCLPRQQLGGKPLITLREEFGEDGNQLHITVTDI